MSQISLTLPANPSPNMLRAAIGFFTALLQQESAARHCAATLDQTDGPVLLPAISGATESMAAQVSAAMAAVLPPPASTVAAVPPPPPVAAAPTPAPTATAAPGAPDLDAAGLPWDERIHAGTRTKTAKGLWKARKGVSALEVTKVTAELQQMLAAGQSTPASTATAAVPPPPPAVAAVAPPPPPPAATAAVPPPPPAAVVEDPAAAQNARMGALFQRINELLAGGTLTAENIDGLCKAQGLAGMTDLVAKPENTDPLNQRLEYFLATGKYA